MLGHGGQVVNSAAACLLARLSSSGSAPGAADTRLLALARGGDPSALDELVRRHQRHVYNLAYRMLRQREDAEDVTQEAFLKAFEALPRLKDDAAFRSWLCRIAANLCLMRLRSRPRRTELLADTQDWPSDHAPCESQSNSEAAISVRVAIAQLPPKYRLAVVAFYMEGRSYKEAARLTGVPVLTLKTRLYRARRMLRGMLGPSELREGKPDNEM
jgi:RNA polymerase sigma-70 factor (ECF subfamily)